MCNSLCLLQTSKLILTSKRDGSALAATMVFALRAEVDARGPLKRFKADAQLYEFKEFEVKLSNPFQVKPAQLEDAWRHWLCPGRLCNLHVVLCPGCIVMACQMPYPSGTAPSGFPHRGAAGKRQNTLSLLKSIQCKNAAIATLLLCRWTVSSPSGLSMQQLQSWTLLAWQGQTGRGELLRGVHCVGQMGELPLGLYLPGLEPNVAFSFGGAGRDPLQHVPEQNEVLSS